MAFDRIAGNGPDGFRFAAWVAAVAILSVAFSLALACAAPLAAVAVLASRQPRRRQALALVAVAWFANQAVGYGVLGYPQTPGSFAWGAVMGGAALLAALAGRAWMRGRADLGALAGAAMLAFAVDQAVLIAATAVLPSGAAAFSAAVILRVFAIHLLATTLLLALHRLATATGLTRDIRAEPHTEPVRA